MNEYFKEISFNVFLEDQLNNELNIIDSSNFTISWYEDLDKRIINFNYIFLCVQKSLINFIAKLKNLKRIHFW